MTTRERDAEFAFDLAGDPYDDASGEFDGSTALGAPGGGPADPEALLTTLWAMLARPAQGTGSTLGAHRQLTADRLVAALRHAPPHLELAVALADLLTLGGSDPARFGESARGACLEAVERLMLTLASTEGGTRPEASLSASGGLPPLVVVALPSESAARRVQSVLGALGLEVRVAGTLEALGALLLETPCDLVLTETALPGAHGPADAATLCDAVRTYPMHLRTPILCIDGTGGAVAPPSPGFRLAPRPVSRAELVLRVRVLLPLD